MTGCWIWVAGYVGRLLSTGQTETLIRPYLTLWTCLFVCLHEMSLSLSNVALRCLLTTLRIHHIHVFQRAFYRPSSRLLFVFPICLSILPTSIHCNTSLIIHRSNPAISSFIHPDSSCTSQSSHQLMEIHVSACTSSVVVTLNPLSHLPLKVLSEGPGQRTKWHIEERYFWCGRVVVLWPTHITPWCKRMLSHDKFCYRPCLQRKYCLGLPVWWNGVTVVLLLCHLLRLWP